MNNKEKEKKNSLNWLGLLFILPIIGLFFLKENCDIKWWIFIFLTALEIACFCLTVLFFIPKKKIMSFNESLLAILQKNSAVIILIIIVCIGTILHFTHEFRLFKPQEKFDTGHSIGDSATLVIISAILGLISVISFVEIIKNRNSEKIDDYRTFYRVCSELFKETKKNGYLKFSGGTLVPGALFKKFNHMTKIGNENTKKDEDELIYFDQLRSLIDKHVVSDVKLEKNIKVIIPALNEEHLNIFRGSRDSNSKYNKTEDILKNFEKLLQREDDNTPTHNKISFGAVNYSDDSIDYYTISNGKKVVFAKTLNTEQGEEPSIIGICSDNNTLIDILEKEFDKNWDILEKNSLIIEDDNIENFIKGIISEDIQNSLTNRLGEKMSNKLSTLKLHEINTVKFYGNFIEKIVVNEKLLFNKDLDNDSLIFINKINSKSYKNIMETKLPENKKLQEAQDFFEKLSKIKIIDESIIRETIDLFYEKKIKGKDKTKIEAIVKALLQEQINANRKKLAKNREELNKVKLVHSRELISQLSSHEGTDEANDKLVAHKLDTIKGIISDLFPNDSAAEKKVKFLNELKNMFNITS